MSSNDANKRKRKPTAIPETVSNNDEHNHKERKARRVSTSNALASTTVSLRVDTPVVTVKATTANTASAATEELDTLAVAAKATTTNTASTEHEESIQRSIGKMIRDLFCSDNAKVNATLDALDINCTKDKKKRESFVTVGGCLALVNLTRNCLDKAIDIIPSCDQVTELWELNELAELTTLHKTLSIIINLTFQHDESSVGISSVGGVEALVKVMKTFPECDEL